MAFGWLTKKDKENEKERNELTSYNPFKEMRKRFDRFFDDFFDEGFLSLRDTDFTPKLDVKEDDKGIYIKAELAGLEEKDIDLTIKDNYLTLKGEKKEEKEEGKEGSEHHKKEISYGYFERTIPLPENVKDEEIKANFKNGILKVEIPKDASKETKRKKIDIE